MSTYRPAQMQLCPYLRRWRPACLPRMGPRMDG
jgi:hypothetical protein